MNPDSTPVEHGCDHECAECDAVREAQSEEIGHSHSEIMRLEAESGRLKEFARTFFHAECVHRLVRDCVFGSQDCTEARALLDECNEIPSSSPFEAGK